MALTASELEWIDELLGPKKSICASGIAQLHLASLTPASSSNDEIHHEEEEKGRDRGGSSDSRFRGSSLSYSKSKSGCKRRQRSDTEGSINSAECLLEQFPELGHKNGKGWVYTRVCGAVLLVIDREVQTRLLMIIDLEGGVLRFQYELYEDMEYLEMGPHLHGFEIEHCVAGFKFSQEAVAAKFHAKVLSMIPAAGSTELDLDGGAGASCRKTSGNEKSGAFYGLSSFFTRRAHAGSSASQSVEQRKAADAYHKSERQLLDQQKLSQQEEGQRKVMEPATNAAAAAAVATPSVTPRRRKRDYIFEKLTGRPSGPKSISGATGVTHGTHIGLNPDGTFDISNIPPEWKSIFKQAGVRKRDLVNPNMSSTIHEALLSAGVEPKEKTITRSYSRIITDGPVQDRHVLNRRKTSSQEVEDSLPVAGNKSILLDEAPMPHASRQTNKDLEDMPPPPPPPAPAEYDDVPPPPPSVPSDEMARVETEKERVPRPKAHAGPKVAASAQSFLDEIKNRGKQEALTQTKLSPEKKDQPLAKPGFGADIRKRGPDQTTIPCAILDDIRKGKPPMKSVATRPEADEPRQNLPLGGRPGNFLDEIKKGSNLRKADSLSAKAGTTPVSPEPKNVFAAAAAAAAARRAAAEQGGGSAIAEEKSLKHSQAAHAPPVVRPSSGASFLDDIKNGTLKAKLKKARSAEQPNAKGKKNRATAHGTKAEKPSLAAHLAAIQSGEFKLRKVEPRKEPLTPPSPARPSFLDEIETGVVRLRRRSQVKELPELQVNPSAQMGLLEKLKMAVEKRRKDIDEEEAGSDSDWSEDE